MEDVEKRGGGKLPLLRFGPGRTNTRVVVAEDRYGQPSPEAAAAARATGAADTENKSVPQCLPGLQFRLETEPPQGLAAGAADIGRHTADAGRSGGMRRGTDIDGALNGHIIGNIRIFPARRPAARYPRTGAAAVKT